VGLKEMKAERIVKLIERAREPLLKEAHIKAYAEAMIEKDREMVCKLLPMRSVELRIKIKETPIILD